MTMQFTKATKRQSKLRLALIGPSGSGKTWTALTTALALGQKVAVIDTEKGSAAKYADIFPFDVLELDAFAPLTYVEAIKAAEAAGYDVIVIDSLSHAWTGKDGALEQKDKITLRSQSNNSYYAWRDVTPMHNALIDSMIRSKCHVIATMRTKTEYVLEKDERTGKSSPRKIGLQPIQRDGMEYEFDVICDMDHDNNLIVSKTRCPTVVGAIIPKPTAEFGKTLLAWLTDGEPALEPIPAPPTPAPAPGNGNGNGAPAPLTLEDALQMTTRKGAALITLDDDQLTIIVNQSKDAKLVAAAKLVLASSTQAGSGMMTPEAQ